MHIHIRMKDLNKKKNWEAEMIAELLFMYYVLMFRYVLTLVVDGMRSVRSFNFDKSASSVLTSCVSNIDYVQYKE